MKDQLNNLQQELTSSKQTSDELTNQITEYKKQIEQLTNQIHDVNQENKSKEDSLENLKVRCLWGDYIYV